MRISSLVRFTEDKSIAAARGIGRAAADFNQAVKVEYRARLLKRAIEQVEIQARALELYEERRAADEEAMTHLAEHAQ